MQNDQPSRSPIKAIPLHNPGQSLEARRDAFLLDRVLLWGMVAAFAILFALIEYLRWQFRIPPQPVVGLCVAISVCALSAFQIRRAWPTIRRLNRGLEGERAVGQFLEEMRRDGYRVLHDIEGDRFNVDHVLIGPAGVFVIETKTVSKTPDSGDTKYDGQRVVVSGHSPDRDPIAQVKALCDHIRDIIHANTGKRPPMRGVVLYPGWYVQPQPKGVQVWVLNPKALPPFVRNEPVVLPDSDVRLIAGALEAHVRWREAQ